MFSSTKSDIRTIENVTSASEPHFDPRLEKVNVRDRDDALRFTIENGPVTWADGEEHAVLRKIDMRLLPYSDTSAYGTAAVFKMIQDLQLYKIILRDKVAAGFILDLSKYQTSTIMAALGSLAVSILFNVWK